MAQAAVSLAFLLYLANSKKRGIQSNLSLKWEVLQSQVGPRGEENKGYEYQGKQSAGGESVGGQR